MTRSFYLTTFLIISSASLFTSPTIMAWDSVGHRISAAVAMENISNDTLNTLREIIIAHPRYQQDFLPAMPSPIKNASSRHQLQWLLGQAANWPDIARGLSPGEKEKYDRPNWHFIDGAWLRGSATQQGNSYIGVDAFTNIQGLEANSIRSQSQADNVMTALDYNTAILANINNTRAERAVALCWVLHLMADIHQPLHTGSLYTRTLFKRGDRGGNAINTDAGNLHARWDSALRDKGLEPSLKLILAELESNNVKPGDLDWSVWMRESRELLSSSVYTSQMKSAISAADRRQRTLAPFSLNPAYVRTMQAESRKRLGLAGLRIAAWFEARL